MHEQKNVLRKQLLAARKALPAASVDLLSQTICMQAFLQLGWRNVQTVCAYEAAPGSGEVDTAPLLSMLANLPDPPLVTMVEPHQRALFPRGRFDVIIVPVVGFDDENHRLGQGGGWYDRFLASQPQAITIGLAHAQSKTSFPHEAHDVPLSLIITEES